MQNCEIEQKITMHSLDQRTVYQTMHFSTPRLETPSQVLLTSVKTSRAMTRSAIAARSPPMSLTTSRKSCALALRPLWINFQATVTTLKTCVKPLKNAFAGTKWLSFSVNLRTRCSCATRCSTRSARHRLRTKT